MGAGKIGVAIASYLAETGDYDVLVADIDQSLLDRVAKLAGVKTVRLSASDGPALAERKQRRRTRRCSRT